MTTRCHHLRKLGVALRLSALALVASAHAAESDAASQAGYEKVVRPFLKEHCFKCHDEKKAKAGLRLDQLGTDFLAGKNADQWKEVIDSINLGDMPPEEEPRPDAKAAFAVTEWVGHELKNAEKTARMAGGRILSRRLNRDEYANTVRDLLQLDENFVQSLKEQLPGDGKAEGFDRLGAALFFDATQLSTYIELGARIAEKAIVDSAAAPTVAKQHVEPEKEFREPKDEHEVIQYQKDTIIPLGARHAVRKESGVEYLRPVVFGKDGEFGGFDAGPSFLREISVPRDGYYRLRFSAGAFRGERGTPVRIQFVYLANTPLETIGEVEVKGTLDKPEVVELVTYLRTPPEGAKPSLKLRWNGFTDLIIQHPELSAVGNKRNGAAQKVQKLIAAKAPTAEIEAAKAEVEEWIGAARALSKKPGIVSRIYHPKYDLAKVPRIFVDWAEFEGPVEKEWPPASHAALCPKGVHADPAALREMFSRLLPRAFRRPAGDDEITRLVTAVTEAKSRFAMDDLAAVRYGLQTVLSSPEFLLLFEPAAPGTPKRRVNDHELAVRLSYFLWSTMPDEELFRLAASSKLREPAVLEAQVQRLLADPRSRAFAENFAGQWLHVRDFESVMPARDYKDYDAALRDAGAEEPIAFFEAITRQNLPILNFLDSDFTMANERLAKFYGIDGVQGSDFRHVAFKPEHHRGGVLTMAGLMTFLADGTRTLPVRRGAWILEEIFNDPPPPPPPNAGEIQPNVKGAKLTVRERLEQHRQEPTCASCHARIDPLGLALENYDAIGAWRDRQNGEGFNAKNAPEIDASGTLPGGRAFASPSEFKQALLAEKDRFARAFTQKMLTYALCRPVGYIDHEVVSQITEELAGNDYRMHTLILGVVSSDPFQTK